MRLDERLSIRRRLRASDSDSGPELPEEEDIAAAVTNLTAKKKGHVTVSQRTLTPFSNSLQLVKKRCTPKPAHRHVFRCVPYALSHCDLRPPGIFVLGKPVLKLKANLRHTCVPFCLGTHTDMPPLDANQVKHIQNLVLTRHSVETTQANGELSRVRVFRLFV